MVSAIASRISGSSDIYEASGHQPINSVNFINCHDGFTLNDLVSYNEKHNEANGEGNRDGHNDNVSRNWGVEGPTEDEQILNYRFRAMKNLLATVAFFTQVGIAVARSGGMSIELLLAEFMFTLVFLAIPLGIGWYGRQRNSLWYTGGGLFLLLAMWRIFFF